MSRTAARRTERLIIREVEDETVVYDLDNEQVTCLDVRTAAVWQAANGRHSVGHVARRLDMSHNDVAMALVRLDEAGLMKDSAAGMSRRTVLKGLGVGAAVVPLMTVMAPPAFAAKSGRMINATSASCSTTNANGNANITFTVTVSGFVPGTYSFSVTYVNASGTQTTTASQAIVVGANGSGTATQPTIINVKKHSQSDPTGGDQTIRITVIQGTTFTDFSDIPVTSC